AASPTTEAPRYLSATRKPWCERPQSFRAGATLRSRRRGRSHHGLISIGDAADKCLSGFTIGERGASEGLIPPDLVVRDRGNGRGQPTRLLGCLPLEA